MGFWRSASSFAASYKALSMHLTGSDMRNSGGESQLDPVMVLQRDLVIHSKQFNLSTILDNNWQ